MIKVKVPKGTVISQEKTFDDLQSNVKNNLDNRMNLLFESYGFPAELVDTNNLKLSITTSTQLTVGAGKVFFPNNEYFNGTTSSTKTFSGLATNKYYLIYIKYKNIGTESVNTVNGFVLSSSDQFSKRYTRYIDGIEIKSKLLTSTNVSLSYDSLNTYLGESNDFMPVGIIKTDGSGEFLSTNWTWGEDQATSGVIDLRDLYVLHVNSNILDEDTVFLKDRNNTISGDVTVSSNKTLTAYKVDLGTNPDDLNIPGTNSSSFTVAGSPVLLGSVDEVLPILNPRISDIYPAKVTSLPEEMVSLIPVSIVTGLLNSKAEVQIKLGWSSGIIEAVGDSNSIYIYDQLLNNGIALAEDDLVGYKLYISEFAEVYNIVSNSIYSSGRVTLVVSKEDGSNPAFDVEDFGNNSSFNIVSPADTYIITAIPVDPISGVQDTGGKIEVRYTTSPRVRQQYNISLLIGQTYILSVRGVLKTIEGIETTIPNGTFTKGTFYTPTITYKNPFLVQMPMLNRTTLNPTPGITLSSTAAGFKVIINGWDMATDYEICWTTEGTPNYQNRTHPRLITSHKEIEIPVTTQESYSVSVRPLMAGQAVDWPINKTVVAGISSGEAVATSDIVLINKSIDLQTYSATINGADYEYIINGVTYDAIKLGGIQSPVESGLDTLITGKELIGKILTDSNGKDYYIFKYNGIDENGDPDPVYFIKCLTGTANSLPTFSTSVTIGTSKLGRRILKMDNLPINYRITSVVFDCKNLGELSGTDVINTGVIRWYQEGTIGENKANTLLVPTEGTFTQTSDVVVSSEDGNRNLIIDAYDTTNTGNRNKVELVGSIIVYARPITKGLATA